MPWQKGKSGNPGGRPKIVGDVRDLAREQTAAAVAVLTKIMGSQKALASARVAAATALLDRGWGRPAQPLEHELCESLVDLLRGAEARAREEKK